MMRRWVAITSALFIILGVLLYVGVSEGGERPTVTGNRLLDVGECDIFSKACVTEERDSKAMLRQFINWGGKTGRCDFVILFKKIEDPTFGTFYQYYDTEDCPVDADVFRGRFKYVCVDNKCDEWLEKNKR